MYNNLTPPVASSVLGAISAALGVCPFILLFLGGKIRKRSRVAKALAHEEELKRQKMVQERERNMRRQLRRQAKEARMKNETQQA